MSRWNRGQLRFFTLDHVQNSLSFMHPCSAFLPVSWRIEDGRKTGHLYLLLKPPGESCFGRDFLLTLLFLFCHDRYFFLPTVPTRGVQRAELRMSLERVETSPVPGSRPGSLTPSRCDQLADSVVVTKPYVHRTLAF